MPYHIYFGISITTKECEQQIIIYRLFNLTFNFNIGKMVYDVEKQTLFISYYEK